MRCSDLFSCDLLGRHALFLGMMSWTCCFGMACPDGMEDTAGHSCSGGLSARKRNMQCLYSTIGMVFEPSLLCTIYVEQFSILPAHTEHACL